MKYKTLRFTQEYNNKSLYLQHYATTEKQRLFILKSTKPRGLSLSQNNLFYFYLKHLQKVCWF